MDGTIFKFQGCFPERLAKQPGMDLIVQYVSDEQSYKKLSHASATRSTNRDTWVLFRFPFWETDKQ